MTIRFSSVISRPEKILHKEVKQTKAILKNYFQAKKFFKRTTSTIFEVTFYVVFKRPTA